MRWLLLVVVLGAAITWFRSTRRARGTTQPDDATAGFGGPRTPLSESPGPAESWDRDAQDEDALMPRPSPEQAGDAGVVDATADLDEASAVAPSADATPNGDLAGVGDPAAVAALDDVADAAGTDAGAGEPPSGSGGDVAGGGEPEARPTQGELTFDEPDWSVPPEEKPRRSPGL
jgi:hypothetical protein